MQPWNLKVKVSRPVHVSFHQGPVIIITIMIMIMIIIITSSSQQSSSPPPPSSSSAAAASSWSSSPSPSPPPSPSPSPSPSSSSSSSSEPNRLNGCNLRWTPFPRSSSLSYVSKRETGRGLHDFWRKRGSRRRWRARLWMRAGLPPPRRLLDPWPTGVRLPTWKTSKGANRCACQQKLSQTIEARAFNFMVAWSCWWG